MGVLKIHCYTAIKHNIKKKLKSTIINSGINNPGMNFMMVVIDIAKLYCDINYIKNQRHEQSQHHVFYNP